MTERRPTRFALPGPVLRGPRWTGPVEVALVTAGVLVAGLAIPRGHVVAIVATLAAAAALAVAVELRFGMKVHSLEARRVGEQILGLDCGALPVDQGRLVVSRIREGEVDGSGRHFQLTHVLGDQVRVVWGHHAHPEILRDLTEGLCRLGGWEMVWRDPEGDEVRTVAELDLPLVDRLAAGRDGDDGHLRAAPARTVATAEGLELPTGRLPLGRWLLRLILPLGGIGAALGLAFAGPWDRPGWHFHPGPVLLALGIVVLLLILERAVSETVAVDPGGVTLRTAILGVGVRRRRLEARALESVYVEPGRLFHHLAFAGDGFHVPGGRFSDLEAAVAARRAVVAALLADARP